MALSNTASNCQSIWDGCLFFPLSYGDFPLLYGGFWLKTTKRRKRTMCIHETPYSKNRGHLGPQGQGHTMVTVKINLKCLTQQRHIKYEILSTMKNMNEHIIMNYYRSKVLDNV